MSDAVQYSVRDPYGNVYGPATAELLRQWVVEGRIIPGMAIGEMSGGGAMAWREASTHPAIAELFHKGNGPSLSNSAGTPTLVSAYPENPAAPTLGTQLGTQAVEYGTFVRPSRMPLVSLILGVLAFLFAVPSPLICCCGGLSIPLGMAGAIVGLIGIFQALPPGGIAGNKVPAWIGLGLSILALLITFVGVGLLVATQWHGIRPAGGGGL